MFAMGLVPEINLMMISDSNNYLKEGL